MAVKINQYKFDKICAEMAQKFGRIRKGEEDGYEWMLFPMESNALKVYHAHPSSSGRRMSEAVSLALFQVKSYIMGEEYDLSLFETEDNKRLVHALLMAFDPFTNSEIEKLLKNSFDLENKEALIEYFEVPVLCLIRLKESVDFWEKERGLNGYFAFTEGMFGSRIAKDEKFDYTISKQIMDDNNTFANGLFGKLSNGIFGKLSNGKNK